MAVRARVTRSSSTSLLLFSLLAASAAASAAVTHKSASSVNDFLPASSPYVLWQGRTRVNPDGSVSSDWESVAATFAVVGTGIWVKMVANVTTPLPMKLSTFVNGYDASSQYLLPTGPDSPPSYLLAANLQQTPQHTITAWQTMEPLNTNAGPGQELTVIGFETSGSFVRQAGVPAPLPRRIDVIGDSQTAGAQWDKTATLCGDWTTSNSEAYAWEAYLARNLTANMTVIAWSGRGLIANCGSNANPTVPQLYLQTEGGTPGALWDFSRSSVPDAVLVHLGQNDYGCNKIDDSVFAAGYVQFMQNITRYYSSSPPSPGGKNSSQITFFCAVGPMSETYLNGTLMAIADGKAAGLDTHFLDLRGMTLDGCGGHPGAQGHWEMAVAARAQVAAVMGW